MIGWLLVPVAVVATLAFQLILWAEFSPRRPSPAEQGSRDRHPSRRTA